MRFTDCAEALRWLVRRLASDLRGRVALVDMSGPAPRVIAGELGDMGPVLSRTDVNRVRSARPAVVEVTSPGGGTVRIARVGDTASKTVLAIADARRPTDDLWPAIAEATWLIGVHLRAERAERVLADVRARVCAVVFDLLCTGSVGAARRTATALRRGLPDPIRLAAVEGLPVRERERHLRHPEGLGPSIWTFRTTAQHDAMLLLAPAKDQQGLEDAIARATAGGGCRVGTSAVVPLREAGTGVEQALHALYAPRVGAETGNRFESRTKLSFALGPAAGAWATQLLRPLLTYEPPRRTAPDAEELVRTARAWLRLSQHAPRNLDIHRNTARDRLRLIGELLGADLNHLADQAVVSLALRVHEQTYIAPEASRAPAPDLAVLFDGPGAAVWASRQLQPLLWRASDASVRTVRTWLALDASIAATAVELGLSSSAVRKRLARVGRDLGRSLLELPGARHDLWLALLIHDRSVARVSGGSGPPVPRIPRAEASAALPNVEVS
ncbi:helix-turn-helix domain-containing protein [Yinghuangia sp. ASG 101]|uniref:helix-turn-helix domain-containing protein n=1 Tax=Yinghuangia sp. ASG 101 TaxID=2896848 RepID=UPI001E35AFA1|nr:helix-turn-helix domain-containing protein [Yinghuangia sp. ASG 101]UGQ09032.1 helix-turn-helix domain-containing protein [Yinghuangia sp. ASG 101]